MTTAMPRRIGRDSKRVRKVKSCMMQLLAVAMFCASIANAQQSGSSEAQSAHEAPPRTGSCAKCHDEIWKGCANNPHSSPAAMHVGEGSTCNGCHGPGKDHAGGGDAAKIIDPSRSTAKEVDDNCMSCHAGSHADSERSLHREGNVSCISCHNIHSADNAVHLLKMPQPQLCFQCHDDVKPQFELPFHHKIDGGLMQCTDCHDPHSVPAKDPQADPSTQMMCVKCHTETAGPFVYEHAELKVEGCTGCHVAHGGSNPRLLNRASVNAICLQCHLPQPIYTTSRPTEPAHTPATQDEPCTLCHSSVHGSNSSAVFFKSR